MILVPEDKIREWKRLGWWGEKTIWQLFLEQLQTRGHAEAVVDAPNRSEFAHGLPQRWTWCDLAIEVDRLSLALLHVGLQRDEVIVAQLPNMVEQFALYLACARLGFIVSPVPVQYREHELEHIIKATRASAVVTLGMIGKGHTAAQMFLDMQARHSSLRQVLAWGERLPEGVFDLSTVEPPSEMGMMRIAEAQALASVSADDVFTVCWTSGTEARPKGVPRSHNEWLVIAPSIIEGGEIPLHARILNPFPLVNMAGIATAFITPLVLGATVIQHHPFVLHVFLEQLRREAVDYTVMPPAVLNQLLQNERLLSGIDFKKLRRIGSGSAPLSAWMVQSFAQRYGVQIVNYFGSNEGAALSGTFADIPDPGLRALYFPRAGVDGFHWSVSTTRKIKTRLVDPDTDLDITHSGQVGELRFRGPTIFSAYWDDPVTTARAFDHQGFYKTGDLFEIAGDQLQYYRYVGRSKDLVIRGGMNISAAEIEGLLTGCPGIQEVAVVGVPDDILGEKVCACVVPDAGIALDLSTINEYLRSHCRVAIYKLPEHLLVLDMLPHNPVGKVLKTALRVRAVQSKSLEVTL